MILRLDFIRLVVHEAAHMLVRMDAEDLNESTPTLLKKSFAYGIYDDVEESGIIAELELFGAKIDFLRTVQSRNFDLDYMKKMYDYIVVKQVSIEKDPSKLVSLNPSSFPKMAVEFDNVSNSIFEF